jgi:hypothetical protein
MPSTSIASQIHQPFDVHGDFSPAITFHDIFIFDNLTNSVYIVTIKIIAIHGIRQINLIEDFSGRSQTDTMNVGKGYVDMFVLW